MIKDANGLNYRQRRFIAEYAHSLNGTQSVIAAGYSKKTARVTAAQLLAKPNIRSAVEKTQARRLKRADITADRVLEEIASVAFVEMNPSDVKPSDKLNALGTLARHLGLLVDKQQIDTRMSVLSVSVSAEDLAQAKALVENFRSSPPLIEGTVEKDEDDEAK
jgi:phage terminase small subunit